VERARALLERRALGRRVVGVDDGDTWVCRPHAPGDIAAALEGTTFTAACRRGKALWLRSDGGDGPTLGLHLGMAGRIVVDDAEAGDPASEAERGDLRRWDRFALAFEDGGRLALRDKRRLGRVRLEPDLRALGPDAAEIDRAGFRARVGRARIELAFADEHELAELVEALERAAARL
jgi:formamidopyrimidine-DNA glycosylase